VAGEQRVERGICFIEQRRLELLGELLAQDLVGGAAGSGDRY